MGSLTLDVIGSVGFGKEFKTLENNDHKYQNIIETIFQSSTILNFIPSFIIRSKIFRFIPFIKKIQNTFATWKQYLENIVSEKIKENNTSKNDVLNKMLLEHNKEDGNMNEAELVAHGSKFI
jgi:cytochrome P450